MSDLTECPIFDLRLFYTIASICHGFLKGGRGLGIWVGSFSVSGHRRGESDGGAFADLGLDADLAPVGFDQLFDDCQADPRSAGLAGARLVRAVEALEDEGYVLRVNARAVILHAHLHF